MNPVSTAAVPESLIPAFRVFTEDDVLANSIMATANALDELRDAYLGCATVVMETRNRAIGASVALEALLEELSGGISTEAEITEAVKHFGSIARASATTMFRDAFKARKAVSSRLETSKKRLSSTRETRHQIAQSHRRARADAMDGTEPMSPCRIPETPPITPPP